MTEAEKTLAERGERYGRFDEQSAIASKIKAALRTPGWERMAPDQKEALDHFAVKMSRIVNGDPDYRDNWHDLSCYAKLVADRLAK